MHVNLLPPELIARSRLIRSTKNWFLVIVLWGLTLLAVCAPLGWKSHQLYKKSESIHAEVGPLRMKETKTQQLRAITADLKKRSQRIRIVLPTNRIPALLGIFGKAFQSKDSLIALQDFVVTIHSNARLTGPANKNTSVKEPTSDLFSTEIIARGYTGANPSVAEVIQRLENFGVFQKVMLKSTRDSMVAEQPVDEFELECVYAE
jgi:hypothetical protein